jgi:hypothetical protein
MEETADSHRVRVELAKDRKHNLVWDRHTGECLTLEDLIEDRDYGRIILEGRVELELEVLDGEARYRCPHCKDAMVIRSKAIRERTARRFYFEHHSRHFREACAGRKGMSAKAILARKFGLNKESVLHIAFKRWIQDSLAADAEFTGTQSETRWWDVDKVKWRQPDVQTVYKGERLAIEVQLATTFVHVIAERMRFYRKNSGRMLWLFKDLDINEFRLAEDDIFYANNRNAFRVTPETLTQSCAEKRFLVECVWLEPCFVDGMIADIERRDIVPFAEVSFDVSSKGVPRAYWFDYDDALRKAEVEQAAWQEEQVWGDRRRAFEVFYTGMLKGEFDRQYKERDRQWTLLRHSFASVGVELPEYPKEDTVLTNLLIAAYSAKSADGRPVGMDFSTLAELGHHFHKVRPEILWFYRCMLIAHEQLSVIKSQDKTRRFQEKIKGCLESLVNGEPFFEPDRSWDRLLLKLFPKVADQWLRSPSEIARNALLKPRTAKVEGPQSLALSDQHP